jgi:hypothetical protein
MLRKRSIQHQRRPSWADKAATRPWRISKDDLLVFIISFIGTCILLRVLYSARFKPYEPPDLIEPPEGTVVLDTPVVDIGHGMFLTKGEGVWVKRPSDGKPVQRWNHNYYSKKCPQRLSSHNTGKRTVEVFGNVPVEKAVRFEVIGENLHRFEMRRSAFSVEELESNEKVVIMSIVKDHTSFGTGRKFSDFLELISAFEYPKNLISISILLSDKLQYDHMKQTFIERFDELGYAKVKLFYKIETDSGIPRDIRHKDSVQRERRRFLARLRNFIVFKGLEDEDAVFWLDVDVVKIPPNSLKLMMDSGRDVITTKTCYMAVTGLFDEKLELHEYDLNTWIGGRKRPTREELEKMDQGAIFFFGDTRHNFVDQKVKPFRHMSKLADQSQDFVEIDSVGGAVLFVRADVHRNGVLFPTIMTVGNDWEYEGYDGMETEGICLLAKRSCYSCWGMPNQIAMHNE